MARYLSIFQVAHVDALKRVNDTVTFDIIHDQNLRWLTLDINGSVVSTGLNVESAQRGYNPHRRKVPSYYPITLYEAQNGLLLKLMNRAGNVHDGDGALVFTDDLLAQFKDNYSDAVKLQFRKDGDFFLQEIFERMDRSQVGLARSLRSTVITTYGQDMGTTMTEFVRDGTARTGRQSQTWVRLPDAGWMVVAAHWSLLYHATKL